MKKAVFGKKRKKEDRKTSPYFKAMVNHIDQAWRKARKSDTGYPFHGRDFKDLAHFVSYYQESGLMALYDMFLESQSDWVKRTGHSLQAFFKCLPGLLDKGGWKARAEKYEKGMLPPVEPEVLELFKDWKIEVKEDKDATATR